jgi:acetolactate synthase small subunit
MQAFHIRYRNTQGTLMRILNAASRRGLDLASVQAEPAEHDHSVTLVLEVNPKQVGQLYREWYAVADVTDVRSSASLRHTGPASRSEEWGKPHPPASAEAGSASARAALA